MATRKPKTAIVTRDAAPVLSRFEAVERTASAIHEQSGANKLARALLSGGKLHAVISDGRSTVEICDGKVAVSVQQDETE